MRRIENLTTSEEFYVCFCIKDSQSLQSHSYLSCIMWMVQLPIAALLYSIFDLIFAALLYLFPSWSIGPIFDGVQVLQSTSVQHAQPRRQVTLSHDQLNQHGCERELIFGDSFLRLRQQFQNLSRDRLIWFWFDMHQDVITDSQSTIPFCSFLIVHSSTV